MKKSLIATLADFGCGVRGGSKVMLCRIINVQYIVLGNNPNLTHLTQVVHAPRIFTCFIKLSLE